MPTGDAPVEGSAAYDAVVVEPQPGELARGGNDEDAALTGRTFEVVVPAGSRLRTRTVCLGRTEVVLTTEPPSAAESDLVCAEDEPREIVVEDPAVQPAATSFTVAVRAAAPARWYAVVSAVP